VASLAFQEIRLYNHQRTNALKVSVEAG